MSIQPSDFNIKDQAFKQAGFIAQNVLESATNDAQKSAVNQWESYNETDSECPLLGISERPILANLVAAFKTQQSTIDKLVSFINSKFPGEFN
jgi:hypothetical protein